uniref:Uncharacterized protein n=1 Tax=Anguilla anguilla TaxID=7936 RepID=A0A0E9QWJ1_ANGAN
MVWVSMVIGFEIFLCIS